jgi:hypothetical protein
MCEDDGRNPFPTNPSGHQQQASGARGSACRATVDPFGEAESIIRAEREKTVDPMKSSEERRMSR